MYHILYTKCQYRDSLIEYVSIITEISDIEQVDTDSYIKLLHYLNKTLDDVVMNDILQHNASYKSMVEYIYTMCGSKQSPNMLKRIDKFIDSNRYSTDNNWNIYVNKIASDQYNLINNIEWLEDVQTLISNSCNYISSAAIVLCEYQHLLSDYSKKDSLQWYTRCILDALSYRDGAKLHYNAYILFVKFYVYDLISDMNMLAYLIQQDIIHDKNDIISLTRYLSCIMMNVLS